MAVPPTISTQYPLARKTNQGTVRAERKAWPSRSLMLFVAGTNAAAHQVGLGISPWQLSRKATSLSRAYEGPRQLLAIAGDGVGRRAVCATAVMGGRTFPVLGAVATALGGPRERFA